MTREEAVKEIEKAFEPAFANYIITALIEGATVSDKEPTTKNDLGVDCISRQAVRDTIFAECSGTKLDIDFAKVLLLQRAIKALPSVTPHGSIMVAYAITKNTKTDKGIEKLVSDVLKQAKKQVLAMIDKYKAESEEEK